MATTPARRLDTAFTFPSNSPLQQDLKRLMAVLEARFAGIEATTGTFEEEVTKFEDLGVSRLNEVLTPLAAAAIEQLQDITALFSATSPTTVAIGTGAKQFLIPVGERNTFVPTPYMAIFAVGQTDKGMIVERDAFDRETGILSVTSVSVAGSGTYSDWEISVSPPPALGGYTRTETDNAIAAAIVAIGLTALLADKANIASPTISNLTMTGTPVAPTPATSDSSTKVATTAHARAAATEIADAAVAAIDFPDAAVDAATTAQVRGATTGSPPHAITTNLIESASASVALTPAATVGVDWKTGLNFTLAINQNSTLGNPSNGIPGTWRTVLVTQDSNGTRTLNYGNQYVFPGGNTRKPVIATGAGAISRISIFCRSTTVFEVYGVGIGLAA